MNRRRFIGAMGAAIAAPAIVRAAAPDRPFKFGVLTDMNGIFSDGSGRGSLIGGQLTFGPGFISKAR